MAVTVRSTAEEKVTLQEPDGALPVQVSPVLACTVTDPEGVSALPACGATENETANGWPTNTVLADTETIEVVVAAVCPVPCSGTCWVDPLVPPLSSVNVSVPVTCPTNGGAKTTLSEQLAPGAIGEADVQFCVEVNEGLAATLATLKGAVPVFVRVTVCEALDVPTGCMPNVRLDGDSDAAGSDAEPTNT